MNINDRLAAMSSEEKEQLIKNSSIKDGQRSLDKINADLRLLKNKMNTKGAAYDLDTVSGQIKRLETKKHRFRWP